MARLRVPNSACIHTMRNFLHQGHAFDLDTNDAVLELHPQWAHMDPVALAMIAAWGAWSRRMGRHVTIENLGTHARYAARMHLFQVLGVDFDPGQREFEEAGRFLPVTQVVSKRDIGPVIGDISAMLHLEDDPESLAAVQYCISELLRNVLEHSGSADGAFVCAHRYTNVSTNRVTIGVADCGAGIRQHLGRAHPEIANDDGAALSLAMRPGVTGALPGEYGTPDNAGAGLFITRSIAKGTGGYFVIASGTAAFRQRRVSAEEEQLQLFFDAVDEPNHDFWLLDSGWQGTFVGVEIRTDQIADYDGFFQWIFRQIPGRTSIRRNIQFI